MFGKRICGTRSPWSVFGNQNPFSIYPYHLTAAPLHLFHNHWNLPGCAVRLGPPPTPHTYYPCTIRLRPATAPSLVLHLLLYPTFVPPRRPRSTAPPSLQLSLTQAPFSPFASSTLRRSSTTMTLRRSFLDYDFASVNLFLQTPRTLLLPMSRNSPSN